jgi:hypothetical protein
VNTSRDAPDTELAGHLANLKAGYRTYRYRISRSTYRYLTVTVRQFQKGWFMNVFFKIWKRYLQFSLQKPIVRPRYFCVMKKYIKNLCSHPPISKIGWFWRIISKKNYQHCCKINIMESLLLRSVRILLSYVLKSTHAITVAKTLSEHSAHSTGKFSYLPLWKLVHKMPVLKTKNVLF